MSKQTITRLFLGAVVAVLGGCIVGFAALVIAIAGGAVTFGGPSLVTVNGPAFAGFLIWLVVAAAVVAGGGLAAIASWVGALLNTAQLDDKTWFVVLLVLGLFSFGWVAMVAYVLWGPDSTRLGTFDTGIAAAPNT
jgi:hypothetical protein